MTVGFGNRLSDGVSCRVLLLAALRSGRLELPGDALAIGTHGGNKAEIADGVFNV